MNLHPLVRKELDNLEIQFPNKALLTLDDYAALYSIKRRWASRHLKRHGIPSTKEGRDIYVSVLELATHRARLKAEAAGTIIVEPLGRDEMKNRSGFRQMAARRQLEGG